MRKLIIAVFLLGLVLFTGCSGDVVDESGDSSDPNEQGYNPDLDSQLDNSDMNDMDDDLNLNWI